MARIAQGFIGGAFLHQFARVQHPDAIAHAADHGEAVTDEQHRGLEFRAQALDQIQHLGFDRGIEARGGLIEDQQGRIAR